MSNNIKLSNVRLSFAHVFEFEKFEGKDTDKYSGTFLIPKSDTKTIELIQSRVYEAMKKAGVKKLPVTANICFKDGDEGDREEAQGHYTLKATNKKRFPVLDSKAQGSESLVQNDGVIYSGCYVNAIIDPDFYCYTNYSKGITSTLLGIQFARDGESFEGGRIASIDEFDDFEDPEGDEDDEI